MKKVFFSIIIPVFNSDKFLKKCIESVILQNFQDYEILLINDCSTDKSAIICQKFQLENPNKIKYLKNKKNLGVGLSRNLGLKFSNGKYIIFLDSDDYLIKNSMSSLQKEIKYKNYPDVILNHIIQNKQPISNLNILNSFGKTKLTKKFFLSKLKEKKLIINECWRLVISNDLIKKNNIMFKDIKIAEDVSFVFKIFILMQNIMINKHEFLFHRSRANSLKYTKGVVSALAYYTVFLELEEYKKKFRHNQIILNFLKLKSKNMIINMKIYFTLLTKKEIIQLENKLHRIKDFEINHLDNMKLIIKIVKAFEKKVINFINTKKNGKKIIIYCAGIMTQSVIKILKKNGIKIRNIIDDDPIWIGKKLMNIEIKQISTLNASSKRNNLIMICNLSKKVINSIRFKLLKLKFKNNSILSFYL